MSAVEILLSDEIRKRLCLCAVEILSDEIQKRLCMYAVEILSTIVYECC